MKFSCYKQDLAKAITFAGKAIATKSTTPILSGIYIKADDSSVEFQATDLNAGIVAKIPAHVEVAGTAVVSGKRFVDFTRNMPDDTLTVALEQNALLLNSGGASVNLLTMSVEDFPTVKPIDDGTSLEIGMDKLAALIKKTVFAAAKDNSRPAFFGVNFMVDGRDIACVATNTHRLAVIKDTLDDFYPACSFIVQSDTLNNLLTRLDSKETKKTVKITKTERNVAFTFDNNYVTARLIEGVFPKYEKVIPATTATHVTVETAEFNRVINFISLMSKETEHNTVKLEISDGDFKISSTSNDIGSAEQSIECSMDGESTRINFNSSYFADFLRAFDGKKLQLDFNGRYDPAKLTDPADPNYIYIVTPVRG